MNAKKAKFLRRAAQSQSQGEPAIALKPMDPIFIPAPPLSKGPGATFLGQRRLISECTRGRYKLAKKIFKACHEYGLVA